MVWVWDEGADEQDEGVVSMCHLHSSFEVFSVHEAWC